MCRKNGDGLDVACSTGEAGRRACTNWWRRWASAVLLHWPMIAMAIIGSNGCWVATLSNYTLEQVAKQYGPFLAAKPLQNRDWRLLDFHRQCSATGLRSAVRKYRLLKWTLSSRIQQPKPASHGIPFWLQKAPFHLTMLRCSTSQLQTCAPNGIHLLNCPCCDRHNETAPVQHPQTAFCTS
jgi:hypothetical protein